MYGNKGDHGWALEQFEKALAIRVEAFGEGHPVVARTRDHIARARGLARNMSSVAKHPFVTGMEVDAEVVLVSSPEFGLEHEAVRESVELRYPHAIGFHFGGSNNHTESCDQKLWEDMGPILKLWMDDKENRAQHTLSLADILSLTQWFQMYSAQVKVAVLGAASRAQHRRVIMACIEGGPITQAEQLRMSIIKKDIEADLATDRYPHASKEILIETFANVDQFLQFMHATLNY